MILSETLVAVQLVDMDAKTRDRDTKWCQKVLEIYSGASQSPSIRLIYAD